MFSIKFLPTEKSHLETPLEENVNRIIPEEGTVEARTIEDAIAALRYWLFSIGTVHPIILWHNCTFDYSNVDICWYMFLRPMKCVKRMCILSSCLQHGAWGGGPSPRAEDESSVCCLWGGQHASPKKGEPQHEVVTAQATAQEGMDESTRKPSEPTLCYLQYKVNELFPPITPFENCLCT